MNTNFTSFSELRDALGWCAYNDSAQIVDLLMNALILAETQIDDLERRIAALEALNEEN